jgi:hypothetical protein
MTTTIALGLGGFTAVALVALGVLSERHRAPDQP